MDLQLNHFAHVPDDYLPRARRGEVATVEEWAHTLNASFGGVGAPGR